MDAGHSSIVSQFRAPMQEWQTALKTSNRSEIQQTHLPVTLPNDHGARSPSVALSLL
jgi:hypothetical protein